MANTLGELRVLLSANTANFTEGMTKAAYMAQQSAKNISREFASLGKIASQTFGAFGAANPIISQLSFEISSIARASSAAMKSFGDMKTGLGAVTSVAAGIGAGIAAAGVGLAGYAVQMTMRVAETMAKMYDLAQSTGVGMEALTAMNYVAQQSGVETETLAPSLERMSKSALAAAESPKAASSAYSRLHIELKNADGTMRGTVPILEDIAARFELMPDGIAKTALAIEIFGRGGDAMIPMLNRGKDGIAGLAAEAARLGIVLDTQAGRKAKEFQETMGRLHTVMEGFEMRAAQNWLPILQSIANEFGILGDEAEKAAGKINGAAKDPKAIATGKDLKLRPGLDPRVDQYVRSLSADQLIALNKNARESGISVYELAAQMAGVVTAAARSEDAAKKLAEEQGRLRSSITATSQKLREQVVTFGMSAIAAERFTFQMRAQRLGMALDPKSLDDLGNLRAHEQIQKLMSENRLIVRPPKASAEDFSEIANAAKELAAQIDAASGAARTLGEVSTHSTTLDENTEAQVRSVTAAYAERAKTLGKTQFQIQIDSLGAGATSDQIERIKAAATSTLPMLAQFNKEIMQSVHAWDEDALSAGNFSEKMRASMNEMALAGESLSEKITHTFIRGFDQITGELVKMVVTGKSNFKQLLQGIEEDLVKAGLQSLISGAMRSVIGTPKIPGQAGASGSGITPPFFGNAGGGARGAAASIAGKIGGAFGLGGAKADGSQAHPFYVVMAGAPALAGATGASAITNLPFPKFPGMGGAAGGAASSGFGSILKSIFKGFFGGFLAGGGDVSPGKTYVVGEKHAEFFTPGVSGRISPEMRLAGAGGGNQHIDIGGIHLHLPNVGDVDGFRRSRSQIHAEVGSTVHRAISRKR